jgi:hypothetical protein
MAKVQLLFALGTAVPPGSHPPADPRAVCAGVRSGLAARRHHVLLPTGYFFGGDSTAFFRRVVCAVERNSTQAHRSCLLVGPRARLYNLKRPKSQFRSTTGLFSMIHDRTLGRGAWCVVVVVGCWLYVPANNLARPRPISRCDVRR